MAGARLRDSVLGYLPLAQSYDEGEHEPKYYFVSGASEPIFREAIRQVLSVTP